MLSQYNDVSGCNTTAQAHLRLTDGAGFDLPDDLLIVQHVLRSGDGAFWVRATRRAGAMMGYAAVVGRLDRGGSSSAGGGGGGSGDDGSSETATVESDPGGLARWRLGCHGLFSEIVQPDVVADAGGALAAVSAYATCDTTGDEDEGRRAAAAWLAATTAAAAAGAACA